MCSSTLSPLLYYKVIISQEHESVHKAFNIFRKIYGEVCQLLELIELLELEVNYWSVVIGDNNIDLFVIAFSVKMIFSTGAWLS